MLPAEFSQDVNGHEPGEEHRAQEGGFGLFVGFDEEFFHGEVEQRGCAEGQDERQHRGVDAAKQQGGADRAECGEQG